MWAMLLGKMPSSVQILERIGSRVERSGESRLISEAYLKITLFTYREAKQSVWLSGVICRSRRRNRPFRQ